MLIFLVLLLVLLFAGLGFALHFLWILAVLFLVFWLAGVALGRGGAPGATTSTGGRPLSYRSAFGFTTYLSGSSAPFPYFFGSLGLRPVPRALESRIATWCVPSRAPGTTTEVGRYPLIG